MALYNVEKSTTGELVKTISPLTYTNNRSLAYKFDDTYSGEENYDQVLTTSTGILHGKSGTPAPPPSHPH